MTGARPSRCCGVVVEHVVLDDLARRGRRVGGSPAATRSRTADRPVSMPSGTAYARHILMPLYCAGLWLAVNIAPGTAERARRRSRAGRWTRDRSSSRRRRRRRRPPRTRGPCRARTAACRGRPRRPSAPRRSPATKADPTARARSSSIWSGTVPRTSYALNTAERAAAEVADMYRTLSAPEVLSPPGWAAPAGGRDGRPRGRRRGPRRTRGRPPSGRAGRAARPRAPRRRARAGRRWTGPNASGSGASRSTSHPRGALSRSLWASQRS